MGEGLVFDFTNLTHEAVGEHGVSDNLIASLKERAHVIDSDLRKSREGGKFPYMDLPYQEIDSIVNFADTAKTKFENFINVGIGGSSLGAQALFMALCHPFYNLLENRVSDGMRMFFADNIDPDLLSGMFDV